MTCIWGAGNALIGLWLLGVNHSALKGDPWPYNLIIFVLVSWVFLLLGLLAPFDSTRVHLSRFIASTVRFILISICGADEPFGHLRACCVVRAKEQNFLLHSLRTFPRLSAIVVEG